VEKLSETHTPISELKTPLYAKLVFAPGKKLLRLKKKKY